MIASPQLESERFWSKVQMGPECWVWTGATQRNGYGHFAVGFTHWVATRYAWTQRWGAIPEGLCVLHRCDNPGCVRPDHLFIGTRFENAIDRDIKGRGRPGGDSKTRQKLTAKDVAVILDRYQRGEGCTRISKDFSVSVSTIENITYGRTWRRLRMVHAVPA